MMSVQELHKQKRIENSSLTRDVNRSRKKRKRGTNSRLTTSRIGTNKSFKLRKRRYRLRTTDSWKSLGISTIR